MDPDSTVRLKRRPRGWLRAAPIVVALVLAGVGGWLLTRPATPPPPAVTAQRAPPPAPAAPAPPAPQAQAPPALPEATEAAIMADQPDRLTVFRFAPNPRILVLDFPGLRQQGLMLNRVAAFAEKQGEPHDRVLTDAELDQAIRAHGDTVETYYYGHDYSAETLRRFFALADRDHVALNPEERRLRDLAGQQGILAQGAVAAIITVPRAGADALVDAAFRRTILHHELSHGEYFTDPAYAAYARHFWADRMSETARTAFRHFLVAQGYDPALTDLTVNETQAYLMHTPDKRAFNAEALGLPQISLSLLQLDFLLGMPAGWLRDCTPGPRGASSGIAQTGISQVVGTAPAGPSGPPSSP